MSSESDLGPTLGRPGASPVEAAARQVFSALWGRDSAFTPGVPIWTSAHAEELVEQFVNQPDISGATFDDKLTKQLGGVSDGAIQLFAELYYLDLLPLSDYKGATKRKCILVALQLARSPVTIPETLAAALDAGVFGGGVAFKTRRFWQLAYLVEFTQGFLALPESEGRALADQPLEFRDRLLTMTKVNAPSQRYGLLYLAFPSFFLPLVNTEHRAQIRNAFLPKVGASSGDQDDDLHRIYAALCAEHGRSIDLYQAPFREVWDPSAPSSKTYKGPGDKWQQFMHWAARLAASVDLDANERAYKVEMAKRLDAVRPLVLADDPAWPERLKSALNYGNLLDSFFKTALFNELREHAAEIRDAVLKLWESESDPALFDQFQTDLRAISQQRSYTGGNSTALGSILLMARDLGQFPPYRPTPVVKAGQLTDTAVVGDKPSERYDALLRLCDEVLERSADSGLELADRLDAQGLIWSVVTYNPPDTWGPAEAATFKSWRGDAAAEPQEPAPTRAWLVRGNNVNGHDLVPTWLTQGTVSLAASKLREVHEGMSREDLKPVVDADYAHTSYAAKAEKLDEFDTFLSKMQLGDLVATLSEGRLFLGTITGPTSYHVSSDERSNLRREVEWVGSKDGYNYDNIPDLRSRLQVQRDVLDLTQQIETLLALREGISNGPNEPVVVEEVVLRNATAELAQSLHVSQDWLQLCVDLLNDRPQLIFYGPPGTGKTYIAQHLAEHVAGDNVRLVQFHPAYSYEDFFEGYRPVPSGGFELRPGPMRKIVDQALDNPTVPHVLIIDEINRGNLAKVFGELYFLLEYRDKNVDLLYASDDDKGFTLPRNVYIIGTMNTADRSIALVDAAMRRRFAFLSLHPSEPPTSGVLRSWLSVQGHPARIADLLDELNARIENDDFKIGPSYFMRPAVHQPGGLERTWGTSILPLLEEHHYGELTAAEVKSRYGLPAIVSRVDRVSADDPDQDLGDAPPDAD
jgi:hypothetical protein